MSQFGNRYYPTVSLRRAEMRALEKLPESEKQKMLPIVLIAPWMNSIKFENSLNIIKKSIGNQLIIVDLDRNYRSSSPLESRAFFWSLLDLNEGPKNWINFVKEHPNFIPCIQIAGVEERLIDQQIDGARQLQRGYCLRFELERHPQIMEDISMINKCLNDDFLVILDFGYSDFTAQINYKITEILAYIFGVSPDIRVAVCGSNFPNDFSEFDDFAKSQPIASRQMYSSILGQFGNYNLYYGDWASTKPRKYDGHGSPPLPRIDYPTATQWIMARSKDNGWSLEDAAIRITRLPEWADHPQVWGAGMIEKTAMGFPGGIRTHPEAMAARINIHLFIQANFNSPNVPQQPKGKWKDPI